MIAGINDVEFEHLQKSNYWDSWTKFLDESILKPNAYYKYPTSSTNNMHHAYSLDILMNYTGIKLNEFKTIIEFGGGYGNTCRLFKKWGHIDDYILYDIPELITIQKFYLNENNSLSDVHFLSGTELVDTTKSMEKSLFLGLWSISETPTDERVKMLNSLRFFECENIFIAMGGTFFNENNLAWLKSEIIPKLDGLGYTYQISPIQHGVEMYYFMAKKKYE